MGLKVKKNKDGLFKLINTVSDEQLHKADWATADKAKAILINRAFWRFVNECIEIDTDFPAGYSVNDRIVHLKENEISGAEKIIKLYKTKNGFGKEWEQIKKKYNFNP